MTLPEPLEGDAPLDEPFDDEPRDTDPDRVEDFEPSWAIFARTSSTVTEGW